MRGLPVTLDRLIYLDLYSLKYRRHRRDTIHVFKLLNQLDDINPSTFFSTKNTNITRNSEINLLARFAKSDVRKFSFGTRVVKGWNALTKETKLAKDINPFKTLLDLDSKKLVNKFDFDS